MLDMYCVILGIGWYFNKFYPHTELFGDFITRSIETGKWSVCKFLVFIICSCFIIRTNHCMDSKNLGWNEKRIPQ